MFFFFISYSLKLHFSNEEADGAVVEINTCKDVLIKLMFYSCFLMCDGFLDK